MDLYAVTGSPVSHSRSPGLFNSAFSTLEIDALYTRLAADTAEEALAVALEIGIRGLNVTAPFKEKMAALVDSLDTDSKEIGAVNCVVCAGGRTRGFNTDHEGVAGALNLHGVEPRGKNAAVLGAGGAARAAVYALVKAGANVKIVNRTLCKAEVLARRFGCRADSLEHLPGIAGRADILVSAVPRGDSMVKPEWLRPGLVILEANYREPGFARFAAGRGCRLISGIDWLVSQAAGAFEIFSGRPVESAVLKKGLVSRQGRPRSGSNISLVGMMGSGKTTVGRRLASAMGMKVVDTDRAIEKEAGIPIPMIFEHQGEGVFRAMESRIIGEIDGGPRKNIYALGGGAVSNPENRRIIRDHSYVVWLWASPQKILERITAGSRPLLEAADKPGRLAELLSRRLADYASASDLIINAAQPAEKVARKIVNEIH